MSGCTYVHICAKDEGEDEEEDEEENQHSYQGKQRIIRRLQTSHCQSLKA